MLHQRFLNRVKREPSILGFIRILLNLHTCQLKHITNRKAFIWSHSLLDLVFSDIVAGTHGRSVERIGADAEPIVVLCTGLLLSWRTSNFRLSTPFRLV